ncbi:hypothetical protein NQ318_020712 [Aromia moschata]|uniref:Chitin-binding type-2 domain-containing protein n=1 Tax=Aromia moschata TaxID=1265417 RepID=A0AAV8YZ15_9CUCU|nr:hypothetical protein NQ318_020712 [Aromia moschata]
MERSTVPTGIEEPSPLTIPTVPSSDTTLEPCLLNSDPDYFVCTSTGRYPNLNDPTCETYFLCSLLRNGSYLKTKYSCPPTAYFHQETHVCDTTYTCPCRVLTTRSETISTTESTVELSKEPSTDTGLSTITESSTATVLSSTVLTEISELSTVTIITDVSTHSTPEVCIFNNDPEYFECSATGRYPNLNDPTCETYFFLLRNGSYLKTKYSCPPTSYFHQGTHVCDTTYTCPCKELTPGSEVTSYHYGIYCRALYRTLNARYWAINNYRVLYSDPDYFECSATGRYPNLNDPTCETYFLCSLLKNGFFRETKYSCPPTSYFNQQARICDTSYSCPCRELTTPSTKVVWIFYISLELAVNAVAEETDGSSNIKINKCKDKVDIVVKDPRRQKE